MRQSGRPVANYINEFEQLSDMFPDIVTPAREKISHFIRGLDKPIRRQMFFSPPKDFLAIVQATVKKYKPI